MDDEGILLQAGDGATYFVPSAVLLACQLDGDDHDRALKALADPTDVEGFVSGVQKMIVFGGWSVGAAIGNVPQGPLEQTAAAKEKEAGMVDMQSLGLRTTNRRLPF